MTHYLLLTPRDPLIARDGRPFGAKQGNRMRSLAWPYPSVLAGSLRTMLGKLLDQDFHDAAVLDALKNLTVAGPLPWWDEGLFFPKPADAAWDEQHEKLYRAQPATEMIAGEGTDLPDGIRPVLLPEGSGEFKPGSVPLFWSSAKMEEWLTTEETTVPKPDWPSNDYLSAPEQDQRTHVKMDVTSGAAEEGQLFMTAGLDMHRGFTPPGKDSLIRMAARIEGEKYAATFDGLDGLHPFGGERRLIHWANHRGGVAWTCPEKIRAKLRGAEWVRLALASPGIFRLGWRPDWPDGMPPGTSVRLNFVGAAVERWQPLSGWSLEKPVGPKPIRRLVSAGSVFFFHVENGDPATLADGWLQSICSDAQDRRDGFGLALWGTWKQQK